MKLFISILTFLFKSYFVNADCGYDGNGCTGACNDGIHRCTMDDYCACSLTYPIFTINSINIYKSHIFFIGILFLFVYRIYKKNQIKIR